MIILSKYTTEVRYICEYYAGLNDSVGLESVEKVIDKSWNKIFDYNWDIFDESYREILCKKILRHYYTREICAETVGLWRMWLNTTMNEIMPKYNQLYVADITKVNPLYNMDITTTYEKKVNETTRDSGTTNESNSNSITTNLNSSNSGENENNYTHTDKYSDTPQGELNGINDNKYLTNVRIINDQTTATNSSTNESNGKTNSSNDSTQTRENNGTKENTEMWTERVIGKNTGESYAKLLKEFRDSIINIDRMIIDELKPLFFTLW